MLACSSHGCHESIYDTLSVYSQGISKLINAPAASSIRIVNGLCDSSAFRISCTAASLPSRLASRATLPRAS